MSEIDWAAAAKYISGESSASERAEFEAWMHANPDEARTIMALAPHVKGRPVAVSVDVDAAWQRVSRRMDESFRVETARPAFGGGSRTRRLVVAGAVAAAIVAGAVLSPAWMDTRANRPAAVTAATGVGEREHVVLRDGSRVTLAPDTRVREYVGRDGSRNVVLSGEALFTVKHDARRFLVHAGGAIVEDLGTAFVVRARPEMRDAVDVAVTEGRVALRGGNASDLVLRAGERGQFVAGRTRRVAGGVESATAWTAGRLVFETAPLSLVGAELERWHDVKIRVAQSVASRTLTASFAGESIDEIARIVATTLGLRYERAGDTLSFAPR